MASAAIRTLRRKDVEQVLALQHACYPLLSTLALWTREHLESHVERFPEGQFVAEQAAVIVGHAAAFVTHRRIASRPHSFRDITGRGTFDRHDPHGDTLYGAEIMVHPDHRRRGIAKQFYAARFELVRRLGLRCFMAGGRIPGLENHQGRLTPEAYVQRVVSGELEDRVLSAQLKSGLRVERMLPDYLNDPRSGNAATLLVWENPELAAEPKEREPQRPRPPASTRNVGRRLPVM